MFGDFRCFLVLCCVLLTVGADTLPILILERNLMTSEQCSDYATGMFGADDYSVTRSDERFVARSSDGTKRVECDTVSGGIWATDDAELFNTANGPPADLPSEEEAFEMGRELVSRLGLLPEDDQLIITNDRVSGTHVAHEYEDGAGGYTREDFKLDISVFYVLKLIVLPDYPDGIPLTGGGGRFQVTYGRNGNLIAFQGLWRPIVGSRLFDMISQEEATAQYVASLGGFPVVNLTSFLAYYSEPFGVLQRTLYPVWVFDGEAVVDGQGVPIRPQPYRDNQTPTGGPRTRTQKRSGLAIRGLDDTLFEGAGAWLGPQYGLGLTSQNVAGFRNGIYLTEPAGDYAYEKSNQDVLASDFVNDADTWADSVDMLFYAGHASSDGWMVAEPGSGAQAFVNYTAFGSDPETPGELLGQQDLEWLIIAACGPLQDQHMDQGYGNVFDRWRGIFDGLHIMMAYASSSVDSSDEGAKFMQYAQEGYSLIDAWLRTGKELQSSEVTVAVMWTEGARDDHLPGYGSVSDDNPLGSLERWAMWTVC
ncbi:hypothetical protein DFP73DRAFT_562421 [Morchella snyderi]|nr:hypothetical protein DFP73DRAFT_562421 [Morchella snyderi]